VVGTAFSRADGERIVRADLRDAAAVRALLERVQPDVIFHCAAERRPDRVELEASATRQLNVDATRLIAEAAAASGLWALYISTGWFGRVPDMCGGDSASLICMGRADYVFDGTAPPYKPADVCVSQW
jgi:dTDP-4-dehydrorhamnose reductase